MKIDVIVGDAVFFDVKYLDISNYNKINIVSKEMQYKMGYELKEGQYEATSSTLYIKEYEKYKEKIQEVFNTIFTNEKYTRYSKDGRFGRAQISIDKALDDIGIHHIDRYYKENEPFTMQKAYTKFLCFTQIVIQNKILSYSYINYDEVNEVLEFYLGQNKLFELHQIYPAPLGVDFYKFLDTVKIGHTTTITSPCVLVEVNKQVLEEDESNRMAKDFINYL